MRRFLVLSTFILLASLYALAACRVPAADEFQAQFDNWSRAYQAHDLDVSMRLFAPELVFESRCRSHSVQAQQVRHQFVPVVPAPGRTRSRPGQRA